MSDEVKATRVGNAEQLVALVRSHANGDERRFLSIVSQLAGDAARRGHSRVAEELQALVAEVKTRMSAITKSKDPIPVVRPRGELAGLIAATFPKERLGDLILKLDLEERLHRIVKEHRYHAKLADHGLTPRRKFLLCGPPGTGKTMTAAAVAGELSLPLFTIQLDGIITKFMGETAAKLRLVFEAMGQTRGVYFFDEVDALAAKRQQVNDVGEARRILNSFLQFLEEDSTTSLIFAATNHQELLDRALFRRFHGVLKYELPDPAMVKPLIVNALPSFSLEKIDWSEINQAATGLSQADLTHAADDAARHAVLDNYGELTTAILKSCINDRRQV